MEEIFPWLYFSVYKSVNPSFTSNFWDSIFLIQQKKETWKSKDYCWNVFSAKTIVFVRIYHQQFQRTSLLMVSDFLAKHTPFSRPLLSILSNLHFTKQGPLKSQNSGFFCSRILLENEPLVPQHLQPRGGISSLGKFPASIPSPSVF